MHHMRTARILLPTGAAGLIAEHTRAPLARAPAWHARPGGARRAARAGRASSTRRRQMCCAARPVPTAGARPYRAHWSTSSQLHSQPPCRAHVTLPRRNGVSGGESNTSHLRRRQPRLAHAARSMNPQHSALRRTAATHGMSALTQMLWCIRLFRRCWACKRPHAGRPPCYHAGSGGSRATPGERCGDAALARARRRRGAVLYLPYPNPGRPGARMGPAWARAARLLRSAATVRLECTRDRRWSILTSSPCSCHAVGLG